MKIGYDHEHIEFEELEKIPRGMASTGEINLKISLVLQEFSGAYSGIWLEAPGVSKFVKQLRTLKADRTNSAKITSMSPAEFVLEVRASDDTGYFEIEAQLHRYQYSHLGARYWPVSIRGGFETEDDNIEKLISYFKDFLT